MRYNLYIVFILFFSIQFSFSQNSTNPLVTKDAAAQQKWVDSVYTNLSLQEKIGQLFMVRAMTSANTRDVAGIKNLIKNNHIGGIIYSKGGPVKLAKLNNAYQGLSDVPMLIGMDAEWGLSMRLDSTYAFPWNMTLGAIKDKALVEQAGKHIGEHCKRIGIHFNFGPDVDINTNPKNPIIGNRSFGEDRDEVTAHAVAFMKGLQSAGVMATGKHFPGHGDTETDSHKALPTITFSEKRIDSIELYPYKKMIKNGMESVMVAHLNVPSLESRPDFPSSLSKAIITDLLKEKMGFEGLIFTDALEMKGVADFSSPGDIDLAAFLAGNDILLISEDVPKAMAKITEAYNDKTITEERLAYSVKKILMSKYKVGLHKYKPIDTNNLVNDLNRLEDDMLNEELFENAITVAKNENDILPLRDLDKKTIAYIKFGDDSGSPFLNELKKYTKVHEVKSDSYGYIKSKLDSYNTVIIGLHRSNANPWKSYSFTSEEIQLLESIAATHHVILDVFVKPYALLDLPSIGNIEGIVVSYQNSVVAQEKSAQIIFGALGAKGQLPVSVGNGLHVGDGITLNSISRLGYTVPERVGIDSKKLHKIDAIAQRAVNEKMTPGIQLLVARKGKVIYNQNFGHHTYDKNSEPVKFDDVYDIASITKIVSSLPLIMEIVEQDDEISINTKLSQLLPEYADSNKANITLKQILSHYARLKPWIPFYVATLDSAKMPSSEYYRKSHSEDFNIKVSNNLYLKRDYPETIQKIIKDTDLLTTLKYRYSDLPYYILKKFIETYYDRTLDHLIQTHFYESLGMNYSTYNPYLKFPMKDIVPTENDTYYRHQVVQGYVHDMGAAMQNGVGGHAGVFSNANDIAKIMQMYLQKGFYGDKRYFKPETVDMFNKTYYADKDNRRGLGFDKPQLGKSGPTCGCLSMKSFGHSGFTGTYAWADPDEELVYVFMANRTYPSAEINMLLRENIRTDIQELIYEAIIN
ncbi:beta-N-acetylhexosaminidase/serine peptidase (GH 3) [Formosa agariphila KMM 3901]|uniref:beta-N-acetylhexosaminidase n=1 Tax=Formosa agariphila (strain DSM 15362 / KCTC 12365 / LMG 23005 / KMM 3901 / M-2Alg 35-1) TaxID=1347342 RepID=T2KLS0_FORAG|nr:glycoside hydrolase family 3 N-terminal domain-containing protein [Formosa agariphila]CDF79408.1 beta-N-acetylhexosaminidase/serine peptidase (GH 3) [Formosa agariphila KMM 3901]